ncbi:MAG: four-carbon acid sugar kinase family protein [Nocardioidaceae bacterium]
MARVLVVADDFTGANAAAAGFARGGLRAVTVGLGGRWDAVAEFRDRFDVVVVTTESRHASAETVHEAVSRAIQAGWPVDLVCCRIDTTLRGNVGVAAQAVLRSAAAASGHRTVGLCVPAHPAAGRHTVDGLQLLDGRMLEDTELARDPRSPVRTSSVRDVLRRGTSLAIAHVPLAVVSGDPGALLTALRDVVRGGADVVVADASTEAHLDRIAAAAVATREEADWVGIDPGPASAALARALGIHGRREQGPLLAVSGSATDQTRTQLQALLATRDVHLVKPTSSTKSCVPDVEATARDLTQVLTSVRPGAVVLLATALSAEDVQPLTDEDGAAVPAALGRVTRRALEACATVEGVYTTGGDVTAAVLNELGARGLEVDDEIVPLAVSGQIVGGSWTGLPIVTKGGLVGDHDCAIACIDRLARAASARSRLVHTPAPATA